MTEPADDLIARLSKLADHAALDQPYRCAKVSFELLLELRAALLAVRTRHDWQPIETAPKDGTEILLTDGRWKRTGYWARRIETWSVDTAVSLPPPTHWLPLPAPPVTP